MDEEIEITVVDGVAGPSLYIDDYRVAGPKPWGGGSQTITWKVKMKYILEALKIAQ